MKAWLAGGDFLLWDIGRQGLRQPEPVVRDMDPDELEIKRMIERNNCPRSSFLSSTVMILIPLSGPTYM